MKDSSPSPVTSVIASRIIKVNSLGNVMYDDFLDGPPASSGSQFADRRIYSMVKDPNGYLLAQTQFASGILAPSHGLEYVYVKVDSSYNVSDTFRRHLFLYKGINDHYGYLNVYSIGAIGVLPYSGNVINAANLIYYDTLVGGNPVGTAHRSHGLVKFQQGQAANGDTRFIPPFADSTDFGHYGLQSTYNTNDNLIYIWASTHSVSDSLFSPQCSDLQSNLGQLCAVDTALNLRWIKYIKPKPGLCLIPNFVVSSVGRPGVLVAGFDSRMPTYNYPGQHQFFIYHIDQNTRLSIKEDPDAPFSIVDRYTLYPNPAKERLTIEDVLARNYRYQVLDATGRLVGEGENTAGGNAEIHTSSFSPGLYVVLISNGKDAPMVLRFSKL